MVEALFCGIPGNASFMGARAARASPSPAFAPKSDSGAKRMVAPSEPPVPEALSYVPELCQASRTSVGPMSSLASITASMAFRIAGISVVDSA
eukprot:scaffold4784_cov388-Prasinococcus_capsulatus_cf.AAC.4